MMHYLECIAMLEYLRKKLYSGQRTQVPASTVEEVQMVLIQLNKKLEHINNSQITIRVRDILEAVEVVKATRGLEFLTDTMKTTLNNGVSELMSILRLLAFEFYKINDFEPTDEIIPIMRDVVSEALRKGVI